MGKISEGCAGVEAPEVSRTAGGLRHQNQPAWSLDWDRGFLEMGVLEEGRGASGAVYIQYLFFTPNVMARNL